MQDWIAIHLFPRFHRGGLCGILVGAIHESPPYRAVQFGFFPDPYLVPTERFPCQRLEGENKKGASPLFFPLMA